MVVDDEQEGAGLIDKERAPPAVSKWTLRALAALLVAGVALVATMRDLEGGGSVDRACWLEAYVDESVEVAMYETRLKEGIDGGESKSWVSSTSQNCRLAAASFKSAGGHVQARMASSMGGAPPGRILVDPTKRAAQVFQGFGGAFTEAAALTFSKLPAKEQRRVVEGYWGDDGLRYTVGRVHMNSCDFCVDSYDFAPVAEDWDLKHFDTKVTHDRAEMIPLMRAATVEAEGRGETLKIFASPWSPPAWLKEPNAIVVDGKKTKKKEQSMLLSAEPAGLLHNERAHRTWAKYFSKFIAAYKDQGISLWGVTVENEPEFSAPWEACRYNASNTLDFVRDHLGPVLREDHPEVLIFAFDHNRDHLLKWAETLYEDPEITKYLDGMAFHWYAGGLVREIDGAIGHRQVAVTTHHLAKTLEKPPMLLMSEGCHCPGIGNSSLMRAERYAHDILSDLWHGTVAWVDWNLLLDHKGGPNHLGNVCDAPIVAIDAKNSKARFQSYYDVIGHFSRHIPPGSVQLEVQQAGLGSYGPSIRKTASNVLLGMEIGVWSCEGAGVATPRQAWKFGKNKGLMLDDLSINDKWKEMCIGEDTGEGLVLANCQWGREHDAEKVGIYSLNKKGHIFEQKSGKCIAILHDAAFDGGVSEGAYATLTDCDDAQAFDLKKSGELVLRDDPGRCLTAAWPYFMAIAFETPDRNITIVAKNDAAIPTHFTVQLGEDHVFQTDIHAHTVQTYLVSNPTL